MPTTEIHSETIRRSGAKTIVIDRDTVIRGGVNDDPYQNKNPWSGPGIAITPGHGPTPMPPLGVVSAVHNAISRPSSANFQSGPPHPQSNVPWGPPAVSSTTTQIYNGPMGPAGATYVPFDPWQNHNPWPGPPTMQAPHPVAV